MSATYYGILTRIGEAKQANALALGTQLKISQLSVGDGGGDTAATPTPDPLQTALIGEWRKAPINQLSVDPNNANYLVAEQVLPEDVGGRWIREWGLWDEEGDLIAVSNCPPTYKPLLAEGSGRTQVIRMVIMVASTDAFTLKIDPSIVLATRQYVDAGLALKADASIEILPGKGMTGGGSLQANRWLALGTPSKLTAATKNVVTNESHTHELDTQSNQNDITGGRILTVGAFGLGADNYLGQADLNTIRVSGFYSQRVNNYAEPAKNYPVGRSGTLTVISAGEYITTQVYVVYQTGEIYSRARSGETWSAWRYAVGNDALVGLVGYFNRNSAPDGWLKLNGAAVSVTTYAQLAYAIYCGDANNATAESGYRCTDPADPTGTRNTAGQWIVLADARGEFTRGLDDGRGVDAGRVRGSSQQDMLKAHAHTITGYGRSQFDDTGGHLFHGMDSPRSGTANQLEFPESGGGFETRPRNIAYLACIKY